MRACRKIWTYSMDDVKCMAAQLDALHLRFKKTADEFKLTQDAVTVAIAVDLLCTMVETGIVSLGRLINRTVPSLYSKGGAGRKDGSGFEWPRAARAKSEETWMLLSSSAVRDPELSRELADAGRAWVPYRESKGNGIVYTRLSYYFMAMRHVRNVGTHQSLELVETAVNVDSDQAGGGPAQLRQCVTHVSLPFNPAAAEYLEAVTTNNAVPTFFGDKPLVHKDRGFARVSGDEFMDGLRHVANDVSKRITHMLFLIECSSSNSE